MSDKDSEKIEKIEKILNDILLKLSEINNKLNKIEKDTEKNAEIATLFTKYKPTIDKIENGLSKMMSPRSWLGYGNRNGNELENEESI
jgi:DNA repair ATPase RecN